MKDVQTDERTAFGFDINQACTDQLLQWVYPPLYPVHDPSTPWGKPDERGRCAPYTSLLGDRRDGLWDSVPAGMTCLAARACFLAVCMRPCPRRALCAILIIASLLFGLVAPVPWLCNLRFTLARIGLACP